MKKTRKQKIADAIEDYSEKEVIARLGYRPVTWYYGGSEHNDSRLRIGRRRWAQSSSQMAQ